MITDDDLDGLADVPIGAAPPVTAVLARGDRLRRRRQAIRAVGVTAVIGGVAASVLVIDRGPAETGSDVEAASQTSSTSSPPLLPNPLGDLDCATFGSDDGAGLVAPDPVPPAEVPDEMRVLPSWTPGDQPITVASGIAQDYATDCGPVAEYRTALGLQTVGPDGIVTGTLTLDGPYSTPGSPTMGVGRTPTRVRGQDATLVDPSAGDDLVLEWREPDGGHWELWASGVDEATARSIAEALELDSSPPAGEPPAQLPETALPPGFSVTAQAPTVPAAVPASGTMSEWSVVVGQSSAPQTGIVCHLMVDEGDFGAAGGVGSRSVTVGGKPGRWGTMFGPMPGNDPDPERWMSLSWGLAPGLVATADCSDWTGGGGRTLPLETVVRFAESMEPVAPDDPRLPTDQPG
jgi:hypothetical protein